MNKYRKSIKVDHTISCDYRLCSILIDFNRQVSEVRKTMYGERQDDREPTRLYVNYVGYLNVGIKSRIIFLNLLLSHASFHFTSKWCDALVCFLFHLRYNIQSRRFDRYTMLRCVCLKISNLENLVIIDFYGQFKLVDWQLSTIIIWLR